MRYIKAIILASLILALLLFTACNSHQEPEENSHISEEAVTGDNELAVDLPESEDPEPQKPPFEGKIAIITNTAETNVFHSAHSVIGKYGEDKTIHMVWPTLFPYEPEQMISTVAELGADLEIKAIIVNTACSGTNAAFERLRETREDIYVIYCTPALDPGSNYPQTANLIAQTANLILMTDCLNIGSEIARQAHKLGAETFVYYMFDNYTNDSLIYKASRQIKQTCNELGIEFIDATYPQVTGNYNDVAAFIKDDVPKMVEKHGKNTAIFSFGLYDVFLVTACKAGVIFPQVGPPSSFFDMFGYIPGSAGIFWEILPEFLNCLKTKDLEDVMAKPYPTYSEHLMSLARPILSKYDMLGRISAWPVESSYMFTITAAEYAVKWINGEVPKEGVDVEVLKQLMEDFAGVEVYLTPFVDDGTYDAIYGISEPTGDTYDNFLLMRMDYITFE